MDWTSKIKALDRKIGKIISMNHALHPPNYLDQLCLLRSIGGGKMRRKNMEHHPLIDPTKIFLPSFHIKLELVKNIVKAMNKKGVFETDISKTN